MNLIEKKIKSETLYDGRILKLNVDDVQLPDGNTSIREYVKHSGGCAVLLIKDEKVLLVRQYRYAYGKVIYEIPAGKLNEGEEGAKAAARELEEETGYRAEIVHFLDLYPSPGYTNEIIHIYLAKSYEFVGQKLDEGEFLSAGFVPLKEALKLIEDGEICDAKTVSAIYKYVSLK